MKLSFANIRSVLEHCGPMTMREIASFFPDTHYTWVGSVISSMRIRVARKQIYIRSYTREGVGRRYLRAVYALGNRPDAPRPKPVSNAERLRKVRERKAIPQVANSVFTWRPE